MISLMVYSEASYGMALELFVHDERQTERALARVMRHGIRHQADAQLLGYLSHDGRLADARGAHQEHRPLAAGIQQRPTMLVGGQIRLDGILHLLFRFCNVHCPSFQPTRSFMP